MRAVDQAEPAFDDHLFDLERFRHAGPNPVGRGKKNQVCQRQSVHGRDKSGSNTESHRIHIGELAEHIDQSHHRANDADRRCESTGYFQHLGVRIALPLVQSQLSFESALKLAAALHVDRQPQHLPQKPIVDLLDSRFHRQHPLHASGPHAGNNFVHQFFAIDGGLAKQSEHPPSRVHQGLARGRDQRDSQRSSQHDPRRGGLQEVAEVDPGGGDPRDDGHQRDGNPAQNPAVHRSSRGGFAVNGGQFSRNSCRRRHGSLHLCRCNSRTNPHPFASSVFAPWKARPSGGIFDDTPKSGLLQPRAPRF